MRIIGGKLKGLNLRAPDNLPVRPTTDMAKEALFNILDNRYNLANLKVLDIFSGTGNIAIEFASRGTGSVTAIDVNSRCCAWIKEVARKYALEMLTVAKSDAFKLLLSDTVQQYDIIFADPPYDLDMVQTLPGIVLQSGQLARGGMFILEHSLNKHFNHEDGFIEERKYGNSNFSFFSR